MGNEKIVGGIMYIKEFMSTIYVGDRYVKGIVIDSIEKEVKIKISEISRKRSEDGKWNYYNDENIENGYLVFTEVSYFSMQPPGLIPDDELYHWEIKELQNGIIEIDLYMGSYEGNEMGEREVIAKIRAKGACLEDPQDPSNRSYD